VPDERAPRPSLLYRRARSVRDSLVAACLLPVPAAPAQQGGVSGFFKGIASKAANAAAAVGQAIDTSLLLHRDFPELKGGERDAAVVAETFECECLNGRGVPVKGRVYILGAGRILFHGKGSNSADAGLHVNWSLVTDVICVRRVSSMGTEALQVLARGGAALQFSAFDGFFARLSFSLGIRSFTKFFDFVGALVDVHGAQRCPVAAGRLTDE
jgi:hypothetical protein